MMSTYMNVPEWCKLDRPGAQARLEAAISPIELTSGQTIAFDLDDDQPELTFVISMQDQNGQEYYVDNTGKLISMNDSQKPVPLSVRTGELNRHLQQIRQQYALNCAIYALPQPEFWQRYKG